MKFKIGDRVVFLIVSEKTWIHGEVDEICTRGEWNYQVISDANQIWLVTEEEISFEKHYQFKKILKELYG